MATYNSTDWLKAKYNNQEVVKIILNSTTAWEEPSSLPPLPFTIWTGNGWLSPSQSVTIDSNAYPNLKVGSKVKVYTHDFGDFEMTVNSVGANLVSLVGNAFPTGDPVNGQYFVRLTVTAEITATQFTVTWSAFSEGSSYPDADYMADNYSVGITKLEVVLW